MGRAFVNSRPATIDDWGTLQATTAADGTSFVALADRKAREVRLANETGATIAVRRVGAGDDPYELLDGQTEVFPVVGNANEIELKRKDESTTQVTVSGTYWR